MTTYIPHLTLPSAIFTSAPASILLPIVLGTAVGYSTRPKDAPSTPEKYLSLKQPPLRPPPWVFGPVWTVLYGLMGYASHRAFCNGTSPLLGNPSAVAAAAARHGATLYTVQLGLNLAWMPLFFGLGRPVAATLDVLALLGINAYLAYEWATAVDRVAGYLMVPYVAWLGFATYLSAGTGYLNGWDFGGKAVGGARTKRS